MSLQDHGKEPAARAARAADSAHDSDNECDGSASKGEAYARGFDSNRSKCGTTGGNLVGNSSSSETSSSGCRRPYISANRNHTNSSNSDPSARSSISAYWDDWNISVPSEETETVEKRTSAPPPGCDDCVWGDARSAECVCQASKPPLVYSTETMHKEESPGYPVHTDSPVLASRIAPISAAEAAVGSAGSPDAMSPPAVIATSAGGAADTVNNGGTMSGRQAPAASACAPLPREHSVTVTGGEPFVRHPAAVCSPGLTAAAGSGADHTEKMPSAATEGHLRETALPMSAAAARYSPSPGKTAVTSPPPAETPQQYSVEQRIVTGSCDSVDMNSASYGMSPSFLYEASNGAEGATPATSLLQHFSQRQEQQRSSLADTFRRRCSDAAAAFRRGSVRKGDISGLLVQPPSPQLQHPLVQEQRRLEADGYSVSGLARERRRPSEEEGELYGGEGSSVGGGGRLGQQQRLSIRQGRRSRDAAAATASSEAKEAGRRRSTAASGVWMDSSQRRENLLRRYSRNSENGGRDRSSDTYRNHSRSEKRDDSGDDTKRGRDYMISPQQQIILTGTAGSPRVSVTDAAAEGAVAEAQARRKERSAILQERQRNADGRSEAPLSADGEQQRRVDSFQQLAAYPEFHVAVPLKEAGRQPAEDSTALHRAAVSPSRPQKEDALRATAPTDTKDSQGKEQHPAQFVIASNGHRGSRAFPFSFFVQPGSRRLPAGLETAVGRGGQRVQQSRLNGIARAQGRQQQVLSFEPLANGSRGEHGGAAHTGDYPLHGHHDVGDGQDALQDAQVRGLRPHARVRAAAADAGADQREERNLLDWCLRRRRPHANDEALSDDPDGVGAERAKVQVANAAEDLPPPQTTLLLPLPEQRARRLRTHVVIEIRDGSHRILEVQVAEVLRMLEQQCEADEQQQLLLRHERRQRRAGRRRARRLRHRYCSSEVTNSTDDSNCSTSDCAEDFSTETRTGSSFPCVSRHKEERWSHRHAEALTKEHGGTRKKLSTVLRSRSSSLSSSPDHLRGNVVASAMVSPSCGSTSALLLSSQEGAAVRAASSPSSSALHSSRSTVDDRTADGRARVCNCPAAAAVPYTTRRRKTSSPFGKERNDVETTADSGPRVTVLGGHAAAADFPSRDKREHDGREDKSQPAHLVSWGESASGDAGGAESLPHTLRNRDPPSSTNATSVTLTAVCSSSTQAENSERLRCFNVPCSNSSSGRSEIECPTPPSRAGHGASRRRDSTEGTVCCNGPRWCTGDSRVSSSTSHSNDARGRVDTCGIPSVIVTRAQINDSSKDFAENSTQQGRSRGKTPKEAALQPGFGAEILKDNSHGSCSGKKEQKRHMHHPQWSHRCFECGARRPLAEPRGCCANCCRRCCCCSMCCCERCRGGDAAQHRRRQRRRTAGIRALVRGFSPSGSSVSSLCAAVERQRHQLQRLQHQRQQRWHTQRQQTGIRSKGKGGADTGRLTYRDCRQAFTDVHPIPSIEVRRHVVLVCLPPVTCFVLWDRVLLLMTDDLEPDHLISQLSKLTRQYAVLERKGRTSTPGAGSALSPRYKQLGGDTEQQLQEEPRGKGGRVARPSPLQKQQEEMWQQQHQQEGRVSSKGSSPISANEKRLLEEHVYHDPGVHVPAGLKYQQQLRHYEQLLESQRQLPQDELHPSLFQGRRLRSCYSSEDAPEELLEEVEEAAAAAREKAAFSLQAATRSCTPRDKRQSVDSLACPFLGPLHESDERRPGIRTGTAGEATDQHQQRQCYDLQMLRPSTQIADSAWGESSRYCSDDKAAAAGRPGQQQEDRAVDAPAGGGCSPVLFKEAAKVAATPVGSPFAPLRMVNSCGLREEDSTGMQATAAVESLRSPQERCQTTGTGQGAHIESPLCTGKQEVCLQTAPLCGAAVPSASVASPPPLPLPGASRPTELSAHQQQTQEAAGAAVAPVTEYVAPPSLSHPPIVAAAAAALPPPRSEAPAVSLTGGHGGSAAGSPLSSPQRSHEQHLPMGQQQTSQTHPSKNTKKQQQQQQAEKEGHQRGPDDAFARETCGEHVYDQQQRAKTETDVTASNSGKGDATGRDTHMQQREGLANSWYDSNGDEKRTYTRAPSSSGTRSRRPSRRSEKTRSVPLGKRTMPFEFAALECIFFAAFQQLNFDIVYLEKKFAETHNRAAKKSEASSILLEGLHSLKEPVALYEDRVTAFDKAFDELLSNNVDLHRMELTRLHYNPGLYDFDPHKDEVDPELEILLEYFDQEMDQFKDRVRHLKQGIDNTERLISLRLALMRNRLIQWELAAAVVAAGIAIGTCISGIFGMNLSNGYEDGKASSHEMFTIISAVITVLALGSVLVVVYLIRTIVL